MMRYRPRKVRQRGHEDQGKKLIQARLLKAAGHGGRSKIISLNPMLRTKIQQIAY
ncbi:hypothetical protein BJY01DRAFT_229484 [Aspergillus pseudoustus]|uniref:Uncharacterized protein n=1 Tax=Aspergillus pseudoustus TaxID=1810923 RepID=A0ABR4IGS1_9EURO